MSQPERRDTERLRLTIPIRVLSLDTARGEFSEDTYTVLVNRTGARIGLKHQVLQGDTLRIINLENYAEADFRVVGPTQLAEGTATEWGIECLDLKRNIWGVEFSPPLTSGSSEAGALLQCRACGEQVMRIVTLMEVEVLSSTGIIVLGCHACGERTYWTYADVARRPREFTPTGAVAPGPVVGENEKRIEKRRHRRPLLKFSILVRNQQGEEEISKTEDISKGGLAVSLFMELGVGEMVKIVYPYDPRSQNVEQKAEVRRRGFRHLGFPRIYGFRFVS
jgi:hypothetical protein